MEINNNFIQPLNTKKSKDKTSFKQRETEINENQASGALEALKAYGQAIVNNNPKKKLLQMIDIAINNYEKLLVCDEKRKQEFFNSINLFKNELEEIPYEELKEKDIQVILQSYFLNAISQDNMALLNQLFNEKNSDNDFRCSGEDVFSISLMINDENKDTLLSLLNTKDKDGNFRFTPSNISEISYGLNKENKDILPILLNAEDENGNFRFNAENIFSILITINKENKDVFSVILNAKDEKGNFRYPFYEITNILNATNKENKDVLSEVINSENFIRQNGNSLANFFKHVTGKNKKIIPIIVNSKDNKGHYRFNHITVFDILDKYNTEYQDILSTMINAKDKNGDYYYNCIDIFNTLFNISPKNHDVFFEVLNAKDKDGNYFINNNNIHCLNADNADKADYYIKNFYKFDLTPEYFSSLINTDYNITLEDIKTIEHIIGKEAARGLSKSDLYIAKEFKDLLNKENVSEIAQKSKKEIIRKLVAINSVLFNCSDELKKYIPLIPKNKDEYCTLLPELVKSMGIKANEISQKDIIEAEKDINSLSKILAKMSDEEYKALTIEQEYSSKDFIKDTYNIIKDLTKYDRQEVYDYFGFELYSNSSGCKIDDDNKTLFISMKGYPFNLNSEAQIKDENIKAVIEQLRPYVIKYSENNRIISNNKEVETLLNKIITIFPELRSCIGKTQHRVQEYDLFKHSLKVMQKITQNPEFDKLNQSDKKILLLASLFHDITKPEGTIDKTHPKESAFDSFYILKKIKLTKEEEIKLYSLLENHEWFANINQKDINNREKAMQSTAFDLQYDNIFDMSKIFTIADMKAIKENDFFFLKYSQDFKTITEQISKYISVLKTSQPLLPVTPFPKASTIEKAIKKVNPDGSTNIKGIYQNKDGLVIIKFNEVDNRTWEKIGFPKGSISRGIHKKENSPSDELSTEDIDTGNIKFFVHGLDTSINLTKFDGFALPDSTALLSVSYAERPESKYRFFKLQGVILNTATKYMHGGGETDSGSGNGKDIDTFKTYYIFGGMREGDRKYISNLIKRVLNMTDEDYIKFVKKNANKPFTEIEPKEVQETIIKAFAGITSNIRKGNRSYNEMYVTNPEVMAVFAYSPDDNVGDVISFVDSQQDFLKQYALNHDFPFIVFGD